ncbi:MAG: flagellar basal body-associated FliL family protein [Nitrospiraceae bacterium]|nr:MAG: flagellar basal body-associated FliL family protein [Nitrospiraceae bacterium]
MAEEKDDIGIEGSEDAPKKKGNKTLIIIIAAACIVLGAGGFVGFKLLASKGVEEEPKKVEVAEKTSIISLDPFVLNLADRGRYLKVTIQFEIADNSFQEALNRKTPQIRDTIITLVSSKSLNSISSPEGKFQLKDELLFRANQIMGLDKDVIKNLYFSEFVMQ